MVPRQRPQRGGGPSTGLEQEEALLSPLLLAGALSPGPQSSQAGTMCGSAPIACSPCLVSPSRLSSAGCGRHEADRGGACAAARAAPLTPSPCSPKPSLRCVVGDTQVAVSGAACHPGLHSAPASRVTFGGDGGDAAPAAGAQPSWPSPGLTLAAREAEAGRASGLLQGLRNPAGAGWSLKRGARPLVQDGPCAQRTVRPREGSVQVGHWGPVRAAQPIWSPRGAGAFAASSAGADAPGPEGLVLCGWEGGPGCATKLLYFKGRGDHPRRVGGVLGLG